jgi:hypothetical protein
MKEKKLILSATEYALLAFYTKSQFMDTSFTNKLPILKALA